MGISRKPPEAMLFDLDGTLFKTETNLLPAYRRTFDDLRREGLYIGETPPESRMLGSLGMLLEQIWRNVMPDQPTTVHERANVLLLQHQLEGLANGEGSLYEGVAETLGNLHRRGIRLFVASNGLEGYVKGVVRHQGLEPLIEAAYSAGEYKTRKKTELVRLLLDRHAITDAWMVGDRSSDVEAGKANGLAVVGCDYAGFRNGDELAGADAIIHTFAALEQWLA